MVYGAVSSLPGIFAFKWHKNERRVVSRLLEFLDIDMDAVTNWETPRH